MLTGNWRIYFELKVTESRKDVHDDACCGRVSMSITDENVEAGQKNV